MINILYHIFGKIGDIYDWMIRVCVVILSVFTETKELFQAVLFLVMIDQITGMVKALVCKEWNWKRFDRLFIKMIIYPAVIMGTFVLEKYLIQTGSLFFTKGIAALIGFRELSSSYNNASKATGLNLFENIMNKFKEN